MDQRQRTKSPRQRATKSPARQQPSKKPTKASGTAKRHSGSKALKVPEAEPEWMSLEAVEEETESAAASTEEKLHRLVAELQKSDHPLSEGVQEALTVATAVSPEESTRKMQSAVSRLSNARDQLMRARQARDNLHRSWAKFIAAAVQRWNQHSDNFGKQDAKMQEAIQNAIEKLQKAKEEMEASKEALNQHDQASSDVLEISDEELMKDVTPQISADIQSMVSSFEKIRARQAESFDESATKKLRLDPAEASTAEAKPSAALEPFGQGSK